jgi:hypothetical protein
MNKRDFLTALVTGIGFGSFAKASELATNELRGWRPIETAPKDQVILLYAQEGDLAGCSQRIGVGQYACSWTGATDKRTRTLFQLFEYTLDNGTNMARVMDASHWMPLPKVLE